MHGPIRLLSIVSASVASPKSSMQRAYVFCNETLEL